MWFISYIKYLTSSQVIGKLGNVFLLECQEVKHEYEVFSEKLYSNTSITRQLYYIQLKL